MTEQQVNGAALFLTVYSLSTNGRLMGSEDMVRWETEI
jgi:hypothetical protein